jgi:hypothetical protein
MLIHGREFQIASLDAIHFKIVDMMKEMPRGKVLDFPAGTGRLSWMLYNEGFEMTAADIGTEEFCNPEIPIVKGVWMASFPLKTLCLIMPSALKDPSMRKIFITHFVNSAVY